MAPLPVPRKAKDSSGSAGEGTGGSTGTAWPLHCPAGEGVDTKKHAATLTKGTPGVLHGSYSYLLQACCLPAIGMLQCRRAPS